MFVKNSFRSPQMQKIANAEISRCSNKNSDLKVMLFFSQVLYLN